MPRRQPQRGELGLPELAERCGRPGSHSEVERFRVQIGAASQDRLRGGRAQAVQLLSIGLGIFGTTSTTIDTTPSGPPILAPLWPGGPPRRVIQNMTGLDCSCTPWLEVVPSVTWPDASRMSTRVDVVPRSRYQGTKHRSVKSDRAGATSPRVGSRPLRHCTCEEGAPASPAAGADARSCRTSSTEALPTSLPIS